MPLITNVSISLAVQSIKGVVLVSLAVRTYLFNMNSRIQRKHSEDVERNKRVIVEG